MSDHRRAKHSVLLFFAAYIAMGGRLCAQAPDAEELVRRAIDKETGVALPRDYTYSTRVEQKDLDASGNVKKTEVKNYEVTIVFGRPFQKLLAQDDQPLRRKIPPRNKRASIASSTGVQSAPTEKGPRTKKRTARTGHGSERWRLKSLTSTT